MFVKRPLSSYQKCIFFGIEFEFDLGQKIYKSEKADKRGGAVRSFVLKTTIFFQKNMADSTEFEMETTDDIGQEEMEDDQDDSSSDDSDADENDKENEIKFSALSKKVCPPLP